jgi:signal transduction histidine kinase
LTADTVDGGEVSRLRAGGLVIGGTVDGTGAGSRSVIASAMRRLLRMGDGATPGRCPSSDSLRARAEELYRGRRRTLNITADRTVLMVLPVLWAGIAVLARLDGRSRAGSTLCASGLGTPAAVLLVSVLTGLPLMLGALIPGKAVTRFGFAACLALWYALALWMSGGRYDVQPYLFAALAILAFYRDLRLLAVVCAIALATQYLHAAFACGGGSATLHRELGQDAWLMLEAAVITLVCARGTWLFRSYAREAAELERERSQAYEEVLERTAQLETSSEQYRALLESTSAVPWELDDGTGGCTYIGAQVERQWGWPADRFRENGFLFSRVHPDDRPAFAQALEEAVASHDVTVDCRFLLTSDRCAILRSFVRHAPDSEERRRVRGISIDVTAQKKLELELHQAQRLESVGRLAAGIAHEINTPVQYISDNCHFLRDGLPQVRAVLERYREALRAVAAGSVNAGEALERALVEEQAVDIAFLCENMPTAVERSLEGLERVARIVRSMKEFSHPNLDAPSSADLNAAILSTLTIARDEYKYVAEVETRFGDIPAVICYTGEFNQALLNIIVNAAHAVGEAVAGTDRKGLIIVATGVDGDHVVVSVADSGPGIPQQIQDKIFDPFFTTKEVGKGSAQGLAIARSVIVERHGGSLTFETERGKGTVFSIRLPIKPVETNAVAPEEELML